HEPDVRARAEYPSLRQRQHRFETLGLTAALDFAPGINTITKRPPLLARRLLGDLALSGRLQQKGIRARDGRNSGSPGRKPWVGANYAVEPRRGDTRVGWSGGDVPPLAGLGRCGYHTQGLRPGLLSFAPNGAGVCSQKQDIVASWKLPVRGSCLGRNWRTD